MLSFPYFWDALIIASLLKLLRMPLFIKYLDKFLQQRNRSRYFIKVVRVRSSSTQLSMTRKLLLQNVLAVVFCYHFLVCVNFLIIRLFVASARSHVENLQSSLTDESFWVASTCEFCESTATGRSGVIIFQFAFLPHFPLSLPTNFRLSQSKSTSSASSTPPTPSHCSPVSSKSRNKSM